MRITVYLCLLALLVSCSFSDSLFGTKEDTTFFSVAKYDPLRDASADLAATVAQAQRGNKRILLEVGGDW